MGGLWPPRGGAGRLCTCRQVCNTRAVLCLSSLANAPWNGERVGNGGVSAVSVLSAALHCKATAKCVSDVHEGRGLVLEAGLYLAVERVVRIELVWRSHAGLGLREVRLPQSPVHLKGSGVPRD